MRKHTPRIPQTRPTLAPANLTPAAPTTAATETVTPKTIALTGDFVLIDDLLTSSDDHQPRLSADGPAYCLPIRAIRSLRKRRGNKPPLFSESDASFESDLAHRCRRARNQLAEFWKRLSLGQRPAFPLQRAITLPTKPVGGRVADAGVAQFQHDLEDFLDRWGLMSMVTWDLPMPQGPLIPAPVRPDSPAMPKHGLHIVLPIHYPVRAGDELLFEIQRQQVELARENRLDTSIAGLPHHEAFGQMLEAEHIEQTIRSRYAERGKNPGFVLAVEHAIADVLGIGINHAKRLRKATSACKRGKRDSISWLRCRVGRVVR